MATRPLAFGIRYRDKHRTVRVRQSPSAPQRYAVEVSQRGRPVRVAEHASLAKAIRDFAAAWRARLH
jgi:hypothetical protein